MASKNNGGDAAKIQRESLAEQKRAARFQENFLKQQRRDAARAAAPITIPKAAPMATPSMAGADAASLATRQGMKRRFGLQSTVVGGARL